MNERPGPDTTVALSGFVWFRDDLPRDLAERYWRDVHGVLGARVQGAWRYEQLLFERARTDLAPTGRAHPDDEGAGPDGMASGTFLSAEDQQHFGRSPGAEFLLHDERNFLARIALQISPPGTATVIVDDGGDAQVEGRPGWTRSIIAFEPAEPDTSPDAFHQRLFNLARSWAAGDGVQRLRVLPLPPYDPMSWQSPGVAHDWPTGPGYLGVIDLSASETCLRRLVAALPSDLGDWATMLVFPVRAVHVMVAQGQPTEVGLRGASTVETIIAAGADNQHTPELLRFVYGNAPTDQG